MLFAQTKSSYSRTVRVLQFCSSLSQKSSWNTNVRRWYSTLRSFSSIWRRFFAYWYCIQFSYYPLFTI